VPSTITDADVLKLLFLRILLPYSEQSSLHKFRGKITLHWI